MYAKIFRQMYQGTLATKGPWQALITFQQMLILADQEGVVDMTPEFIARETTIPLEIIRQGITELELPDPGSRTPTLEGRRISRLDAHRDWGWQITNYEKYRAIKREEDRREYQRQYWHKRKAKQEPQQPTNTTQHDSTNQPIAEAYTKTEAKAKEIPPTPRGATKPAVELKTWLSTIKASGAKPVPEDDPVFAYAERVGIPNEFLGLAWLGFKHRYLSQYPDKRYKDWRKVFRNAVESNWLKFWWVDGTGAYSLTTAGTQAKKDHEARANEAR